MRVTTKGPGQECISVKIINSLIFTSQSVLIIWALVFSIVREKIELFYSTFWNTLILV